MDVCDIDCIIMNADKNAAVCRASSKPKITQAVIAATYEISRACIMITTVTIAWGTIHILRQHKRGGEGKFSEGGKQNKGEEGQVFKNPPPVGGGGVSNFNVARYRE